MKYGDKNLGIFSIINGESWGGRARYPLNENHWSNVLAFLLSPNYSGDVASIALKRIWTAALTGDLAKTSPGDHEVTREVEVSPGTIVDIVANFADGARLLIEVKTDSGYQDLNQLTRQQAALADVDRLLFVHPRSLSELAPKVRELIESEERIGSISWKDIAVAIADIEIEEDKLQVRLFRDGISEYWSNFKDPLTHFEYQFNEIIKRKGWSRFYPDDFEDAYMQMFPQDWEREVSQRGLSGQANAHQIFLMRLASLTKRGRELALVKTGAKRTPRDRPWGGWGWPTVDEYQVVTDD